MSGCRTRWGLLAGVMFCLLGARAPAWAGECAAPLGASAQLGELGVDARMRFLRQSLKDTARSERRYIIGWSLVYAGFIGGTWVLYPAASDKPGKIIESSWSNAISILGAAQMTIAPLLVI